MMKVHHIITSLNDGGAEAVLFRLITHDKKNQHAVVSLTTEGKYGPMLRDHGVPVVALDMPRGRLTWRGKSRVRRPLLDMDARGSAPKMSQEAARGVGNGQP